MPYTTVNCSMSEIDKYIENLDDDDQLISCIQMPGCMAKMIIKTNPIQTAQKTTAKFNEQAVYQEVTKKRRRGRPRKDA